MDDTISNTSKKRKEVENYFKDALCAESVEIIMPNNIEYDVSAILKVVTGDKRGTFYLAKIVKVATKVAENEKLKAERDSYKEGADAEAEIVEGLLKENEKLKKGIERLREQNYCTMCGRILDGYNDEVWETKDGKKIKVADLTEWHAKNIIRMILCERRNGSSSMLDMATEVDLF